jgi:hypothetical protein
MMMLLLLLIFVIVIVIVIVVLFDERNPENQLTVIMLTDPPELLGPRVIEVDPLIANVPVPAPPPVIK